MALRLPTRESRPASPLGTRAIRIAFAGLALLLLPALGFADKGALPVRPNILLLVAEDMSPRLGAFGDPVAVTPNIDRLASQGVRFPNTFTTAGVCAPSRAALITGRYQTSIGAHAMRASSYARGRPAVLPQGYEVVPPPAVKAFPELLRAAGYATLNGVKTDYQFGDPFSVWDENGFFVEWSDHPEGRPFFAMQNFMVTHESGLFPKRLPRDGIEAALGLLHLGYAFDREAGVDPESVEVPAYYPDTPTVRRSLARQYDNIAVLDAEVGRILAELEAKGLAESTIVVFTTDHGDGLPRAKREVYDSGIRVPLVIRWPRRWLPQGLEVGSVDPRLVSFIDLAPQILAFAGLATPPWMHGRPFVGPESGPPRERVFAAKDRMDEVRDRVRAVRDQHFKYIRNFRPEDPGAQRLAFRDRLDLMAELWALREAGKLTGPQALWFESPRQEEELYDLRSDPDEVRNLADDPAHAATLGRLRADLDAWLLAYPDLGAVPEAELIERFWPGGVQPVTVAPTFEVEAGGTGARRLRLRSASHGASIGYRRNGAGSVSEWDLFTEPFEVLPGDRIETKAIRYGYAESDVVEFEVPEGTL